MSGGKKRKKIAYTSTAKGKLSNWFLSAIMLCVTKLSTYAVQNSAVKEWKLACWYRVLKESGLKWLKNRIPTH